MPENLADEAIERSAQLRRQSKGNYLSRNHATSDRVLRYKRLESVFFSGTAIATKRKSIRGNKGCQVLFSDKDSIAVHPMKSQDELETALH